MVVMTQKELAFHIWEWRRRNNVQGDEERDYKCSGYIIKVHKNIPRDRLGLEQLFEYHYG
jgi:hypothetical protein